MANLYVYEQGTTLDFKDKNLVAITLNERIIPTDKLERIVVFGDIKITTICIQELLKMGIPITFLSKKGEYFGSLEATNHVDIKKQRLQFQKSADKDFCLELSRILIRGKINNQRAFLFKENKIAKEPLAAISAVRIKGFVKKVNIAKNIEELNEIIKEMDKLYFTGLSSFFEEFEKLLRSESGKIIGNSRKISYRKAIEYQITLLIKAIENDSPKDYVPFEIDK